MAAPNYEQVQSFARVQQQLAQAARDEFLGEIDPSMTLDEIMEEAARVAAKFKMLGAELGAQWYDLCAELAGLDVEPAEIPSYNIEAAAKGVQTVAKAIPQGVAVDEFFSELVSDWTIQSVRETGQDNLWRDYYRGVNGGRWARVPVGETCAWCLRLASAGAYYTSKETALSTTDGGRYHSGCNCIAVYYANPEEIKGYGADLGKYKDMYYHVQNMRIANANGTKPYDEAMATRIANAKAEHNEREEQRAREAAERGEKYKKNPWTVKNEELILMRDVYGLK